MAKKSTKIFITVAALAIISAATAGTVIYTMFFRSNAVRTEGGIFIGQHATLSMLSDSLAKDGGYLKDMGRFHTAAELLGLDSSIRPGHYSIKKGMSYVQAVRMFQRGLQTPVKVTFNNIRLLPQLGGRLERQLEPDSLSFVQTFMADTVPAYYGFTPETFIAMFIPDTYEMYWTTQPAGFLDRMKKEYDRFWNDGRQAKLKELGLSETEVATLASIVYEETKMSDEMPAVAGVYINRLRLGMKLQADPTVKFAVGDFTLRRILYRHLDADSPYNTYMYAGLPPGPICMPSVKAIDAVLNYQRHDYLYFCAKPDFSGYHNFATTLAQHNRNKEAWVAALNRAGIR